MTKLFLFSLKKRRFAEQKKKLFLAIPAPKTKLILFVRMEYEGPAQIQTKSLKT